MKKIKTFFMIVVIIIFAVLAYFITKRIMFNRIEEKFWAAITEAERNGNYHIITRQRTSSEEDYHKVEAICKNGRYYIYRKYNTSDNVGTGYLMLSPGEVYYIKEDKIGTNILTYEILNGTKAFTMLKDKIIKNIANSPKIKEQQK